MDKIYRNYGTMALSSKKNIQQMKNKWSFDSMHDKFNSMLDVCVPKFAERMKINLPQLQQLPKLTKLKKEETK